MAKSACFSFESEFSGRGAAEALKQARTKGIFWQRCTLNFLGYRTNYKAKKKIGKITNLFCIYLFQIDKFINKYTVATKIGVIFLHIANGKWQHRI
jgi:hypothetical protein